MTDKNIAGINFRSDRPTSLSFQDLYRWVIWQFPQPDKRGLCGAVRPPLAGHEWIPAIIEANKKQVHVHAHAGKTYATPEQAVKFFNSQH